MRRALATALCAALLCFPSLSTPARAALPAPVAPSREVVAEQWVNPMLRVGDTGAVKLTQLTTTGGTVSGTVETAAHVEQVQIFTAPPVGDLPSAFNLLGLNPEAYPLAGPIFAPGDFSFTYDELGLTTPGIHAVLVRAGEETTRFLVFIPSDSTATAQAGTLIWPLAADIPLVPGETGTAPERPELLLANEGFTAEIEPGGRLDQLVDLYPGGHTCLAIDPQLIDTVSRMAGGYTVTATRVSSVEPTVRLRERWTAKKEVTSTPGRGAEAAQRFLDKVDAVSHGACVIPLPWAGADLSAALKAGVLPEALDSSVLEEELNTPIAKNLIIPSSGYVTPEVAAALPAGTGAITGDALSAQLAIVGEHPLTVGYSDPLTRFDYRLDTPAARRASAVAAVQFTRAQASAQANAQARNATPEQAADQADQAHTPPIILPPRLWSAEDAAAISRAAGPSAQLHVAPYTPGQPLVDPTALTDVEVTNAAQQQRYVGDLNNLMVEDPNIALSPEEFTAPVRTSIAESLSLYKRRALDLYERTTEETRRKLDKNRDLIQALRASVRLMPPGNVYTRTSNSSPVVIVAQNGLPLPVEATIQAESSEARVTPPGALKIPAQGSITTQVTADVPRAQETASMRLWLANDTGAPISDPVSLTVQTKGSNWWAWLIAGLLVVFFVVRLALRRKH